MLCDTSIFTSFDRATSAAIAVRVEFISIAAVALPRPTAKGTSTRVLFPFFKVTFRSDPLFRKPITLLTATCWMSEILDRCLDSDFDCIVRDVRWMPVHRLGSIFNIESGIDTKLGTNGSTHKQIFTDDTGIWHCCQNQSQGSAN